MEGRARKRSGFTLIELLIVVAIIAILAAILLPALNLAKDAAKTAKCMSNQRQAHVAALLYCDDFDSYFPKIGRLDPWETAKGFPFNANVWPEALGPLYVDAAFPSNTLDWGGGRALIFECPAADRWRSWKVSQGSTLYKADNYGVDFGITKRVIRTHWSDGYIAHPIRVGSLAQPIIYMADTLNTDLFSSPASTSYGIRSNHQRDTAANFTFTDGHTETSKEYGQYTGISDYPWDDTE